MIKVAKRLGYVPNRIAAACGADQSGTLMGMCLPRLTSGLFRYVLDGVDRALSRLGYQLLIGANNHSADEEGTWAVRSSPSGLPARF